MNLQALRNQVIQKLRERATPRHWPAAEIDANINRGCKKFAGYSKAREQRIPLYPVDIASALFAFPDKLLNQSGVFWSNIKLDHIDSEYLDNTFASQRFATTIGDSENPPADWRGSTADAPTSWLIEDGMVRFYPVPTSMSSAAASSLRLVQQTTLVAGAVDIVVAGPLPTDKNMIDVYLNGVYQNKDQWSVINTTTIRMIGSLAADADTEVVFFAGATAGNTKAFKYIFNLLAGATVVMLPRPYIVNDNAISVKINGISQSPSEFTESTAYVITLNSALIVNSAIEVTIYERQGTWPATIKCCRIPTTMVNDADAPDLPDYMEDYHDCIWYWALVECFSREGQEKDMSMASFYGSLYSAKLAEYKQHFGPPVIIAPRDAWRI